MCAPPRPAWLWPAIAVMARCRVLLWPAIGVRLRGCREARMWPPPLCRCVYHVFSFSVPLSRRISFVCYHPTGFAILGTPTLHMDIRQGPIKAGGQIKPEFPTNTHKHRRRSRPLPWLLCRLRKAWGPWSAGLWSQPQPQAKCFPLLIEHTSICHM